MADGLQKYNGHVFASMMSPPQVKLGKGLPTGWSARTRCRPDLAERLNETPIEFDGLCNRIARKAGSAGAHFCSSSSRNALGSALSAAMGSLGSAANQVTEEAALAVRKIFDPFVVSPIDKLPGDGIVL